MERIYLSIEEALQKGYTHAATEEGFIHDHPFNFTTHILKGGYVERIYEIQPNGEVLISEVYREEDSSHFVPADLIHEIIELPYGDCYTVITPQPWEREVHFWKFEDVKILNRRWDETEFKIVE